mmetsp:Transcript_15321/g.47986  ORF Transcript_15321/g.47986 Transcript_15321/m.47986 type:complete len:302 (+) Transcript_15321:1601-2506(+)
MATTVALGYFLATLTATDCPRPPHSKKENRPFLCSDGVSEIKASSAIHNVLFIGWRRLLASCAFSCGTCKTSGGAAPLPSAWAVIALRLLPFLALKIAGASGPKRRWVAESASIPSSALDSVAHQRGSARCARSTRVRHLGVKPARSSAETGTEPEDFGGARSRSKVSLSRSGSSAGETIWEAAEPLFNLVNRCEAGNDIPMLTLRTSETLTSASATNFISSSCKRLKRSAQSDDPKVNMKFRKSENRGSSTKAACEAWMRISPSRTRKASGEQSSCNSSTTTDELSTTNEKGFTSAPLWT